MIFKKSKRMNNVINYIFMELHEACFCKLMMRRKPAMEKVCSIHVRQDVRTCSVTEIQTTAAAKFGFCFSQFFYY